MVGSDNVINEIMHTLTGHQHNLQIIQIVGMGGIGKTTLARKIYENPLIVEYFDILAWITISQEKSGHEILLQVLRQQNNFSEEDWSQRSEDELGERVYKYLSGMRYLIVMDDIWNIEAWDKVSSFFPNNNRESRIMITSRLSNLDFKLSGCCFQMNFLDEDESWNLLCEIVFGNENGCPSELEKIGKEIAKHCRGLPLSIVVIGGLLTKSKMTRGYWEYILENLNSLINLENNEHCLQILRASYKELPIHLKPCFLYMGVFPEDDEIRVSQLIKLWVAEGFLKPIDGKSLEVTAEEYLKELTDRNLILVHKLGWNGKAALCKIHDLLRYLCLREAQKQKFLCVLRQQHLNIPQDVNMERRICIYKDTVEEYSPQFLEAFESPSLTRSFLFVNGVHEHPHSFSFRLLRVYTAVDQSFNYVRESSHLEAIFEQANLRYLSVEARFSLALSGFPSSFSLLWNLQTLIVVGSCNPFFAPPEIWKMPLLRHVVVSTLELPDPSSQVDIVLENLQTLSSVYNLKCGKEVVKRIPNVKKLKLKYGRLEEEELPNYGHNNLGHLQKLESLELVVHLQRILTREILHSHLVQNLTFPHSLRKLTLKSTSLHWEDLTTKIGPLPLLEFLKLEWDACTGPKWETVEGQFCSLKFLEIQGCGDLKYWMTDSTHFPRLEHLVLVYSPSLKEIPSSIGDIPTLQSIRLTDCSRSSAASAQSIKREQEELGNVGLKVLVQETECCFILYEETGNEEGIRWLNEVDNLDDEEDQDQVVSDEEEDQDQVVSDEEEDYYSFIAAIRSFNEEYNWDEEEDQDQVVLDEEED